MDARQEWEADRNQVIRAQQIAREEAAERRESEARQAERQASTEAAMHARQLTGEPIPTTADVLSRARALSETGDGRDQSAPYASAARPAVWWARGDGSLVEASARPSAGMARSVSQAADDELLRQARESSANSYMRVQIARAESRRRHEVSRAGDAVSRDHADVATHCRSCGSLVSSCKCAGGPARRAGESWPVSHGEIRR